MASLCRYINTDLHMAIDFPQFETECKNVSGRPLQKFSRQDFPALIRHLCQSDPENTIRHCIVHLSEKGLDTLGAQILPYLAANDHYLAAVLDPELLSLESAKRVSTLFRKADPYFFAHLSRLAFDTQTLQAPSCKTRALAILDDLSKDDPIVPWLRELTQHPDERVRSKAVKVLCRLRPSKSTVQLHLQSTDPRVRANAIEALWHTPSNEAVSIFKSVLKDPHHRVVANALVGLYYRKDSGALNMMINLTDHPSPKFRLATIWALGTVADRRAIPTLQKLMSDPSELVREKAVRVLATFGPDPGGSAQRDPTLSGLLYLQAESGNPPYPQVA